MDRCACCESATFEHPDNGEECESVDGMCEHFARAGWRPVWLRGYLDSRAAHRSGGAEKLVFSRGAWICPECVRRFTEVRA